MNVYYYGTFSLTDRIGGFIFNIDWLLIPILTFISSVIRKSNLVKTVKTSEDNENSIKKSESR